MRASLLFAATCCAVAFHAAPACPIVDLNGWQPQTESDTFTQGGLGLSTAESFSVVTRVTLPPTFAKWGAAFSLGDEATHQFTLTFSQDQGRAYLSGGGTPNVLGGKTWYVPKSGFDATTDGGKTLAIALVNDRERNELSLWFNGEKQALSATKDGTGVTVPALSVAGSLPCIRLGNRIYNKNDATQHFNGAAYDYLGIFGSTLTEAQIKGLSDTGATGNAALLNVIKAMEGTVAVALATGEGVVSWEPAWNGKVVVLSGEGTLALEAAPAAVAQPADAPDFAPAALYLENGTRLTIAAPMGREIVADTLWVGEDVTLSADFTAPPATSGTYAVLRSAAGTVPPLNGTVTYPTGANVYHDEETALNGGEVTIAVIQQDTDGAYLLGTPADYEWFLTMCPNGASVKLTEDIVLETKAYTIAKDFPRPLVFDGGGKTLTFPKGATLSTTGNAALVAPYPYGAAVIKDVRVKALGDIITTGTNAGVVAGFCGANATIENVAVEVAGKISSTGSVGAVIGGTYGASVTVNVRKVRADLEATARLSGATGDRGIGGCIGAYRSKGTLSEALVVAEAGATLEGANGRGLLVGYILSKNGMPTLANCAAVDFGAKASGLTASAVGTPTLFCAEASALAETEGVVRVETGTLPARDGATVALLRNTEEALLVVPETMPEGAAWKMAKAEGANTVTVSPTDATALDPGATLPLEYAFHAFATVPEGTLWDDTVSAVCTPTMLVDGWAELRNESDYAWYASAERDASQNVRMAGDITLASGKNYEMRLTLSGTFDGQGHVLRVPADTSIINTAEWSYGGCLASSLNGATIKDVTVDFRGTIAVSGANGRTAGVLVGTTQWQGKASTFTNVRAYIGETATLSGTKTGALAGDTNAGISTSGCVLLDSGVTHGHSLYSFKPSGTALYTGNTVDTAYGAVDGTYCLGEQEGVIEDGRLALTEAEGLQVSAAKTEGWTLALEGNTVTVSGGSGVCSLTYGLEGFEGVKIPVSFTPMALTLPEAVTATPAQKALLMAKAVEATLPVPAKVTFQTHAAAPTLDALEVFEGILRADKESGALVVGYDFGISKVTVEKADEADPPMVVVTVRAQNDQGWPVAFAEGAQMNLVRTSDGSSLLSAPVALTAGASEGTATFPLAKETEFFRARIVKVAGN